MFRSLFDRMKRRRFAESTNDTSPNEPGSLMNIDIDLHDVIIEAVLESADKKAEDNDIQIGEDFVLPLAEVGVDAIKHDIDFDVSLPMKARDHGLLFIHTRPNSTSLCFMRVGRLSSQMSSR